MRPLAAAWLLSAVLFCGCRDFKLGDPISYPASHSCKAAEECESGLCVEGICCEKACAADELCTLPGFQGYCTKRPPGFACEMGEQCPGGLCLHTFDADQKPVAFCCEAECAADSACDLPGHEGRCTPRPNGAACASPGQCPSGFCVDGVCCATACTETCHTCSAGAQKGVCDLAPANTDARKECGLCGACLRGLCGPAEAGTDPNGGCGEGLVCGAGQNCGLPGKAPCEADSDCAVGQCFMSRCLQISSERIWLEPMSELSTQTRVRSLATDSKGQLAFAVAELAKEGGYDNQYLYVLVRHATGVWTLALDVEVEFKRDSYGGGSDIAGGLTFWNDRLFVALYQPSQGLAPKGLYGRLFSSTFQAGPAEFLQPSLEEPDGIELHVDGGNNLFASTYWAPDFYSYRFQLQRREAHAGSAPTWTSLTPSPLTATSFDVAMIGGRPLLATLDQASAKVTLRWTDEQSPTDELAVPPACDDPDDVYASTFEEAEGQGLLLTTTCYDPMSSVALWRPWLPKGQRWTAGTVGIEGAMGLPGAKDPLLVGVDPSADFTTLDAVLAWRGKDGTWTQKVVVPTRGGKYVTGVRGIVDPEGNPVLVVGSGTGGPYPAQTRIDLVRLRP